MVFEIGQRVGDAWKLGRRDVGDGLLIVVAKNDRKLRIATAKALEGAVPDLAARQIIERQITPAFKQGDYAGGLNAGNVAGNTLIIAADTTDTSPEDFFKLEQLVLQAATTGGVYANKATVTIANVAPTLALFGANNVEQGQSYVLDLGNVNDPGNDKAREAIQEHLRMRYADLRNREAVVVGEGVALPMRAVFESLGVADVVTKSVGTSNPYNMIRATFDALTTQTSPKSVAQRRGKKIADLLKRGGAAAAEAQADAEAVTE